MYDLATDYLLRMSVAQEAPPHTHTQEGVGLGRVCLCLPPGPRVLTKSCPPGYLTRAAHGTKQAW